MPTFSQSLEQSLHRALAIANERHHQYATLEHLLLSLIDDSDAAAVMRACSVDLDKLRTSLVNYLETEFENLVTDGADDAKPTADMTVVVRDDGKKMWAYKGKPLYTFKQDTAPGETKGDGFLNGAWHMATP